MAGDDLGAAVEGDDMRWRPARPWFRFRSSRPGEFHLGRRGLFSVASRTGTVFQCAAAAALIGVWFCAPRPLAFLLALAVMLVTIAVVALTAEYPAS